MKDKQKEALLEYINKEEKLEVLDPDGGCSFIKFDAATIKEEDGILYYSFDVRLDPKGKEVDKVFTYQPSVMKVMDENQHMHLEFVREFETYFIEWIKEGYY